MTVTEMEPKLMEMQLKNPNYKLDFNQSLNPHLVDILSNNNKKIIQKDGNIKLKGYLIKGAPSLGTKFNPQFRDKNHMQSMKPQSRGLTKGKIIQIASKAVAVMSQPPSLGPSSTSNATNYMNSRAQRNKRRGKSSKLRNG